MKKIILFILLLSNLGLTAQSLIPTRIGIKLGTNLDNVRIIAEEGVQPTSNSSISGIIGGLCVYIPLSDKWYINPELLYAQKGSPFSYNFIHDYTVNERTEYEIENTLVLSYLQLNPTLSFKANDYLALNFGPSAAFLIGENYTINKELITGNEATGVNELLEDDLYSSESLDIGINVGITYFIKDNLLLEAMAYTGLIDVGELEKPYQQNTGSDSAEFKIRNQGVTLVFSYLF